MTTLSDLEDLKRKAERMRQQRDRAQGRLEEAQKRLKEEFKVNTITEAKKLLKTLGKKEAGTKAEFEQALEEFNEKWGDKLD